MISDTLTLQQCGCLYPTIHTVTKNLSAETNYRAQKKSLKFPEEFEMVRSELFPHLQKGYNTYTMLNNLLIRENFLIINNWQDGHDDLFFVRTECDKNFIMRQKKIGDEDYSKIQQNIETVLTYCAQNAQRLVLSSNYSNVFRDKSWVYVTMNTDDGIRLKVIRDEF